MQERITSFVGMPSYSEIERLLRSRDLNVSNINVTFKIVLDADRESRFW